MAGMEPQRRATNAWTGLVDRLVTRWRFALGARRALGAEPVEAIIGDVSTTPEALAAPSEAASHLVPAQVHSFHRPVLVLNPRSGSAQAVRRQRCSSRRSAPRLWMNVDDESARDLP